MKKKMRRRLGWLVLIRILAMVVISLAVVLITRTEAAEVVFGNQQLLEPLERLIRMRFPNERPVGEWLISENGDLERLYTGRYRVLLKPNGSFVMFNDSQELVFAGLWMNWKEIRKRGGD